VYFELHDIEKDFLPHFKHFYNSEKLRTCTNCGTVMATDKRFVDDQNKYES
jgi:3-hydroxyanthranilate 3,4-dioxygenase